MARENKSGFRFGPPPTPANPLIACCGKPWGCNLPTAGCAFKAKRARIAAGTQHQKEPTP